MAELKAMNIYELMKFCDNENQKLRKEIDKGKVWGRWRYKPNYASVQIKTYEIELSRIATATKLGDWLLHLAEKNWITTSDLGNLVVALTELESVGYHKIERPIC